MRAIATWAGGFRTVLDDGRTHQLAVDLPREEGGESSGTTALELAVLSLAGCISTIFTLVARRRRLAFEGMTVGLEAERPEGAPTITRVRGTFRLRTKASAEEVATALRLTVKTCPVGVLFEKAGIPLEITPYVEHG
ncbi:MAG TPA: OsmC family protein [Thermoplasmata archaeon]|nr:OsmC family protein [Thermoplasmata archaeon]